MPSNVEYKFLNLREIKPKSMFKSIVFSLTAILLVNLVYGQIIEVDYHFNVALETVHLMQII